MKRAETYPLFGRQTMILLATVREDQPDTDLLSVQKQRMLMSTTSRSGQLDANLHPVQNPEQVLINNKQEGPARC
jgi:hypothetical protein